jgi:branched-chain amino acid transport system substrate-binding protein
VVASIGIYSGPAGGNTVPLLQGVQLWVADINHKGGANGHAVQLIVYDDGGDPARHQAQVKEAVEQKKVIAFLQETDPFTHGTVVDYINSKRVPVVGTDMVSPWDYTSPMHFPAATGSKLSYATTIYRAARELVPKGETKLGTLVCVESSTCTDIERVSRELGAKLGMQPVYSAKTSLAQPDFTAECLGARNAGVQIMVVSLDSNSISRLAGNCARQDYRPRFTAIAQGTIDRFKSDPNLATMIWASNVFPYFQVGTPGTDEFHAAAAVYGKDLPLSWGTAAGWTAGKLFEKATANLPPNPTRDDVLRGLWSIKNDDLGGITAPLTFTEDKPATPSFCWFSISIKDQAWTSPDRFQRHCEPPPQV